MVFRNIYPAGNGKARQGSGQTHLWLLTQLLPSFCSGSAGHGQAKAAPLLWSEQPGQLATAAPTRQAAKLFGVVAPHCQFPCSQQNRPVISGSSTAAPHTMPIFHRTGCKLVAPLHMQPAASQHPSPTLKATMSCSQDAEGFFPCFSLSVMKSELSPVATIGTKTNPQVAEILYSREAAALEEIIVQHQFTFTTI